MRLQIEYQEKQNYNQNMLLDHTKWKIFNNNDPTNHMKARYFTAKGNIVMIMIS